MADMLLLTMSCVHLVNGLLLVILGMVNRFQNIAKMKKLLFSGFDEHYIAMPVWVGVFAMAASNLGIIIASRRTTHYKYKIQMVQVFKTFSAVAGLISFLVLDCYVWNLSNLAIYAKKETEEDYTYHLENSETKIIKTRMLGVTAAIVALCVLELLLCCFSIFSSSAQAAAAGVAYQALNTNDAAPAPNTVLHSVPASGIPHMMMVPLQQTVPEAGFQSPQA